jgi:hypothetical protein
MKWRMVDQKLGFWLSQQKIVPAVHSKAFYVNFVSLILFIESFKLTPNSYPQCSTISFFLSFLLISSSFLGVKSSSQF